jgi:hypothetical protein
LGNLLFPDPELKENFKSVPRFMYAVAKFNEDDLNEEDIQRFLSRAFVFIDVFSFRAKRESATIHCGLVAYVPS